MNGQGLNGQGRKPGKKMMSWHDRPFGEALNRYEARADVGIDASEAARRRARYGPNRLPAPKRSPLPPR